MTSFRGFIERHAVVAYYILTFAISWGGFLLIGGTGLFAGTDWQTDPLFFPAVGAMLLGPPVASLLLTALIDGMPGLGSMLAGLLRWRVGARWYAAALLIAPLVQAAVLLALSLTSSTFLPGIVQADGKVGLLLMAVMVGLVGGLVEEMGWTGFAIPRLLQRQGVVVTGVIVGLLWTAWHLLQMSWVGSTSSGGLTPAVFLPLYFLSSFAALTAYRVLMVWVYDRTESLLVAVLMHASYIISTLFVLAPPTTGAPFLIYSWLFAGVLWVIVALVVVPAAKDRRLKLHHLQTA